MDLVDKGVNVAMKDSQGEALRNAMVGLGWDMKDGHSVDVDASILMLKNGRSGDGGKVLGSANALCYYGQKDLPGLHHNGDNLTGEGDGDDERINIDFAMIPTEVTALAIFANIYAGADNFGSISNVKCNVYDNITAPNTPEGLATAKFRTDLTEDYSGKKTVLIGEFYRHDGAWKYKAIGEGYDQSLKGGALSKWE